MWKCPQCETLNKEEQCVVCGSKRPADTYQQQPRQDAQKVTEEKIEKKNSNGLLVAIIALFTVVIIALAGIIINLSIQNRNDASESAPAPTAEATQPTVTQPPESTAQPTFEPTIEPVVTVAPNGFADEAEISRIRDIYNYAQDVLPYCDVMSDGYYGIKYYYYGSHERPIRVDVPLDTEFGYGRNYYFDDGKLCFALVFKDKYIQHRFYFKDGVMIRWKNNTDEILDNAHDNHEYQDWSRKILKDAAMYESQY